MYRKIYSHANSIRVMMMMMMNRDACSHHSFIAPSSKTITGWILLNSRSRALSAAGTITTIRKYYSCVKK